ncbi:MAG: AI-2E family transporter [Segniliparus sp.]|uniref:AI-2E family transporter n=1 Tax=Segniliparus sp. TaxID=2804064 RepID=UPI003F32B553
MPTATDPSDQHVHVTLRPDEHIHLTLRRVSDWTWRILVILLGLVVLGKIFVLLEVVLVPVALALLLAALMSPLVDWLAARRVPRSLAVGLVLVLVLGALAGIFTFIVRQAISGWPTLQAQVFESFEQLRVWAERAGLHFSAEKLEKFRETTVHFAEQHRSDITQGVFSTASALVEGVTGFFLALFTLIFFLSDGRSIWLYLTQLVPVGARERVRLAGGDGYRTLTGYVKGTVLVAAVDAIGIGVGLALLQVPLALPLASLVFLGAFVPVIGSLVAGSVAVLVALVTHGPVVALATIAVLVGVMQLESHVLQPLVLGRAVKVHPLAVILAIAAGVVMAGIIGALLAVPLVAVLNTFIGRLVRGEDLVTEEAPGGEEQAEIAG